MDYHTNIGVFLSAHGDNAAKEGKMPYPPIYQELLAYTYNKVLHS
jgi:hypothetical protein